MRSFRTKAGALLVSGLVFMFISFFSASSADAFEGDCTPDSTNSEDGTCTLDEPEGNDPATHGTVTYDRTVSGTSDTLAFDFPDGLNATEVQVCLTLVADSSSNPYQPTNANTCSGSSPDRAYQSSSPPDPVVVDVAAFFASNPAYAPGAGLWFTVHVVADGMTLYVTGSSIPAPPTFALTVTKDVESDTESETFSFTVDCGAYSLSSANSSEPTITFSGGDASFVLGEAGSVTLSAIPDGTVCTVTETAPNTTGGEWVTEINGVEDADRSESVTLDADRTLDFVNTFEEVQTRTVTTTTTSTTSTTVAITGTTVVEDDVEVLGVQTQRQQLPRTGISAVLALLGSAMTVSGAALMALGRHRRWADSS